LLLYLKHAFPCGHTEKGALCTGVTECPALAGADKVHVALVGMLVDTHCLPTAVKTLQRMVFYWQKKNGMLVDSHCLITAVKALQRIVALGTLGMLRQQIETKNKIHDQVCD